ncbi:prepilin-type N-terminal cleavage/methylation domain-containing protein [Streptohalobacillus salinus]|uniref:Prepilin-type N-terminal cleavage/methylation domain-containing protein n=1 Tax=Streptohalobacillus salinus TaxID=621096 RepID=A0A2V3W9Y8_9BACI|nr:prepilin-type N-terminal cleavage/methylation domain-containing protein [Streptohalobacillus salinus]PXW90038.1 prepilin-type N-terminal cleavage/methylation domain-containing protein [Streptohalobacillus salinus]
MIKNEKGITLVELLAALAILSIILLLVGSAHIFGQRQYFEQNKTIQLQDEVRAAMSQLTTDVRKVTADTGATVTRTNGTTTLTLGENNYTHQASTLKRNGVVISDYISTFNWEEPNERQINIEIESTLNDKGKRATLTTTVYFRR